MEINPYESPRAPGSMPEDDELLYVLRFRFTPKQLGYAVSSYQSNYYPLGFPLVGLFVTIFAVSLILGSDLMQLPEGDAMAASFVIALGSTFVVSILMLRLAQRHMMRQMDNRFGIAPDQPTEIRVFASSVTLSTHKTTATFPIHQITLLPSPVNLLIVSPMRGLVLPIPPDADGGPYTLDYVVDHLRARFGWVGRTKI